MAAAVVREGRHVLPDEHAHLVAGVEPGEGFDLDVLADHIESVGLGLLDVVAHRRVGRRRVEAVRPPALVERAVVEEELVVQGHAQVAFRIAHLGNLAHRGIGVHLVHDLAAADDAEPQAVEVGLIRGPELHVRDGERQFGVPAAGHFLLREHLAGRLRRRIADGAVQQFDADLVPAAQGVGRDADAHRRGVDVGHDVIVHNAALGYRLEPDGLPDAGHRGIPDTARVEHLLAVGLEFGDVGRIRDFDDELLLPALEVRGNVVFEGCIGTRMGIERNAVDRGLGLPVDAVEVQQDPLALPGTRDFKRGAVPEGILRGHRPADARERGFDGEGDEDLAVRLRHRGRGDRGDGIVPESVQGFPVGTHHLRARVLRMGIRRGDLRRPAGHDVVSGRRPVGHGFLLTGSQPQRKRRESQDKTASLHKPSI